MKVFIVLCDRGGEESTAFVSRVFTTLEKAQEYVKAQGCWDYYVDSDEGSEIDEVE